MVSMGLRRSQVAFWRLFPCLQENLQEDAGDLQEVYRRMPREVLEVLKVGKRVERVAEG